MKLWYNASKICNSAQKFVNLKEILAVAFKGKNNLIYILFIVFISLSLFLSSLFFF